MAAVIDPLSQETSRLARLRLSVSKFLSALLKRVVDRVPNLILAP
jgi:hypothetical protein